MRKKEGGRERARESEREGGRGREREGEGEEDHFQTQQTHLFRSTIR